MKKGDILGHEFMGELVEVGAEVAKLRVGDRVVVPFPIACGQCWYCRQGLWSLCDNSNPSIKLAEAFFGYAPAGIFGYSHIMGGYAGGQAEYVRVAFADVGPFRARANRNGSAGIRWPKRRTPSATAPRRDGPSVATTLASNHRIERGFTSRLLAPEPRVTGCSEGCQGHMSWASSRSMGCR